MNTPFEFPERLWKKPIEIYNGKPRLRFAASSYAPEAAYPLFGDRTPNRDPPQNDESVLGPEVIVSTEAGNAKVTVELTTTRKEDLRLNCTEDSVTLSVRTSTGPWVKEIRLPFRVDPDTAKAVFRNGRLELVVRKHGKFNPPQPRLDWV